MEKDNYMQRIENMGINIAIIIEIRCRSYIIRNIVRNKEFIHIIKNI